MTTEPSADLTPETVALAIEAFIARHHYTETYFNQVALRVFAYQYENNTPYRRFCDGKGMTPQNAARWQDIPPAPAQAFKRFALTCAPEQDCTPERGGRIFHSSGTTGSETSRHFMDAEALKLYRYSLWEAYSQNVMQDFRRGPDTTPRIMPIFALMPPPSEAPHSSLSFMLQTLTGSPGPLTFERAHGGGFFWGDDWQARLADALRAYSHDRPVVLFGTAFAWVHFLDSVDENFALPQGSVVIETGGFKGRSREVTRDELYAAFTERLGVPPENCGAEYGMSEMASQFYDACLSTGQAENPPRKIAPPWLKTRVLDPLTGQECAPGTPGLLAHYDLANLNSVMAIQTEDMGYAHPDGGIVLLGRAPGAVLRGCSLTAEELFEK